MGTDELQRLLIFGVFIAGVMDKRLNGLAAIIFFTIRTGNKTFGQAAFLHFAFRPAQIPGAVQIPQLAALTGLLKFTAGLAVRATTANFLCTIHRDELPSE